MTQESTPLTPAELQSAVAAALEHLHVELSSSEVYAACSIALAEADSRPAREQIATALTQCGVTITPVTVDATSGHGADALARLAPLVVDDGAGNWALLRGTHTGGLELLCAEHEPRPISVTELMQRYAPGGTLNALSVDAPGLHGLSPSHVAHGAHDGHHTPPLTRALELLRLERSDAWVVASFAAAVGVLSLATPLAVQALVTNVSFGALNQPILVLAAIVVAVLAVVGLLRTLQLVVVEALQQRVFLRLVSDLCARLPRVRGDVRHERDTGKLVNRFFDVVTIQKATATLLIDGVSLALELGIALLLLAVYNPLLLGLALSLLIGIAFVVFGLGRGAVRSSVDESWAKHAIADWFGEVARHPITFSRSDARNQSVARTEGLARSYLKNRKLHFSVLLRQHVGLFTLQAVAAASLLGVGGALVVQGQLTLGQLVAAELVVAVVIAGLSKLGKQLETVYDVLAAFDKVGYLVDLPTERSGGERSLASGPTALEVVNLAINSAEQPNGPHVSFRLPAGDAIAVLGDSGSGKSTTVDAIYGFGVASVGQILIDGVDARSLSINAIRERITLVRDREVFDGTVADNLRCGKPGIRHQQLMEALSWVELDRDVMALPLGLDTPLLHGGGPLTSSQALRLTLARALLTAPGLLIVDGTLDAIEPSRRMRILNCMMASRRFSLLIATNLVDVASALPQRLLMQRATTSGPVANLAA